MTQGRVVAAGAEAAAVGFPLGAVRLLEARAVEAATAAAGFSRLAVTTVAGAVLPAVLLAADRLLASGDAVPLRGAAA